MSNSYDDYYHNIHLMFLLLAALDLSLMAFSIVSRQRTPSFHCMCKHSLYAAHNNLCRANSSEELGIATWHLHSVFELE